MKIRPIEQIGCDAGGLRRCKVALLVPDHEASIHIDRITLKQTCNHSRSRLAAVADETISLDRTIGMMWTELERIYMRTDDSKLTRHPFVQIANVPLLEKPPRDSRLVRYYESKVPGIIDCFYGTVRSFHPPDPGRIKSIAVVLIEHAIAIKILRDASKLTNPTWKGPPIFRQARLHFNI